MIQRDTKCKRSITTEATDKEQKLMSTIASNELKYKFRIKKRPLSLPNLKILNIENYNILVKNINV